MNRKELETAAIRAHARGDTWNNFWPTVAGDVAAAEPDYYDRGRLVHRLIGLVASGDSDGMRPVPATWGQPEPWELADRAQPVPAIVPSDTETSARLLWSPQEARP
jgi:hypothetical protein